MEDKQRLPAADADLYPATVEYSDPEPDLNQALEADLIPAIESDSDLALEADLEVLPGFFSDRMIDSSL